MIKLTDKNMSKRTKKEKLQTQLAESPSDQNILIGDLNFAGSEIVYDQKFQLAETIEFYSPQSTVSYSISNE